MRAMFGLVDCNNFYCSCERVFNPELRTQPVVVLSNNDGCIIARSNEAKALGIEMGMPFYQAKELLEREKVAVFSSNYTLYGDMSRRVMMLLSEFTPELTQYSIDEAFIDLTGMGGGEALRDYGKRIVRTIGKGTGIPVTLGIAPTKTLAKVASKYGKRYKGYEGVCLIDTEEKRIKALQGFDIADVWGIGRRSAKKLEYYGVKTAWDFTQWSESRVRRLLTVTGTRTWKELRGENCIDISELPEKQSICTSRSFPDNGLSELRVVEEAVANFAASCVRKLREQKSRCSQLTVFAYTSRFRKLRSEWREDGKYHYKKAGVIVWNISPDTAVQAILFDSIDRTKQARLSVAIDAINRRNGFNTVKVAVQGTDKRWHLKCEHKSAQYSTNLCEVIKVKV